MPSEGDPVLRRTGVPAAVGVLTLVGMLAVVSACTADSAPPTSPTSRSEEPQLEVLDRVIAEARWYAADGTFLSRDIAILSLDALTPGQAYPFRTVARYRSAMETCRLSFKQMLGDALPARYPPNETDQKHLS